MKTIVEVSEGGLESLLGQEVTLFCVNYFYTGTLTAVDDMTVKLSDPSIIYDTGSWESSGWEDTSKLPSDIFVQVAAIESFGVFS